MEFKDLKSAWNTYSSQEMDKHRLGKESINELLRNRTQTLVDKIDRNIRIGMGILLVFIAYVILDSLFLTDYFSNMILHEVIEYPKWLIPIDFFSTTLIVTTYLFFAIRYLKIRRNFSIHLQLKDLVKGILETLQTYQRMFYLAIIILLVNVVIGFTAGLYEGIKFTTGNIPGGMDNLSASKIARIIGIGLAVLIPVVAAIFLILRWAFNKLYGCYMLKLNGTLKELDESEVRD